MLSMINENAQRQLRSYATLDAQPAAKVPWNEGPWLKTLDKNRISKTCVCVWGEKMSRERAGEIGEKTCMCVVRERETHRKTCQFGLRLNEEAIE